MVVREGGAKQPPGVIGLASKPSVAGEVVEDHAAVARRQVAAGQDLLECSRQRIEAWPGAGQVRDVGQVCHGVVGSVCADADQDALALANDARGPPWALLLQNGQALEMRSVKASVTREE